MGPGRTMQRGQQDSHGVAEGAMWRTARRAADDAVDGVADGAARDATGFADDDAAVFSSGVSPAMRQQLPWSDV